MFIIDVVPIIVIIIIIIIMKVSESTDMEEAAEGIHRNDVQLCRRLGQVLGDNDDQDVPK